MEKAAARSDSDSSKANLTATVSIAGDTVSAEALLQGRDYLLIELHGVCYELRLTKRHRLLLQKLHDGDE